MIAVITNNGVLRIAAEIPIPNGRAWSATRMSQLFAHMERFVFAAELADKDLPQSSRTNPNTA